MKKYETIVIFKSDVTKEHISLVAKKLEKIMKDKPGQFLKKDDWGIKKFAYPVNGYGEGRYVFWYFENEPVVLKEIDKSLRFDESILRYSTLLTVDQLEGTELTNKKTMRTRGGKRVHVDYKEPLTVTKYLTERGKIVPRRVSGVDARTQRRISQAVKRARQFALLSFTDGMYVSNEKSA
ncbi:MAG: 30S ribosomal protein S18 [Bdellovibrionales bacterium]|nr:30S ribosomal protein S18 [Bdellovibrionales bacterium]